MVSDVSMTCSVPQLTVIAPFVQTKVLDMFWGKLCLHGYVSVRQTYH